MMWDILKHTPWTTLDRPNPHQPDTRHAGQHAQPCSDITSQVQSIFLFKIQVLRRGEHESYRHYRGEARQCGTFQQILIQRRTLGWTMHKYLREID